MNYDKPDEKVLLTKGGELRKRKPKTSNNYFTSDTEEAILEYRLTTDPIKRNEIFNSRLNYAFHKLAENIIHTFKFYYKDVDTVNELRHEVVSFLLSKLHLYTQSKGKAYSYFGTIAKRYLIVYNDKNYSKLKNKAELEEVDNDSKIVIDQNNIESSQELISFIDMYINYVDKNLNVLFPKEIDQKTATSILELFKKRENLEIFDNSRGLKKALFIYIREMTDVSTPQITKVIKKLKNIYIKLYNVYYDKGYIDSNTII
jgi:hypothetical protein